MIKKIFMLLIVCLSFVFADVTPQRVGPVSQYGQLVAGKNSSNQGRIYGSCEGIKDGTEVQIRGMSLYWSLLSNATEFYNSDAVSKMVSDMKIQIIRIPMATGSEDWGEYKGYASDAGTQKNFVNTVVEAAIKQDIYVIIDWHSHCAEQQTQSATSFFSGMAQTWGGYDHVIFEIYNEPKNSCGESYPDDNTAKSYWANTIKPYANSVISAIRKYSDNLIIVGTPYYDQFTNVVTSSPLSDNNVAYTFHYYAGSHSTSSEGAKAQAAINAGYSVFVSEWGTGNADGKGEPSSANAGWQTWLNNNKLSWANWSASKIGEGTAAFNSGSTRYNFSYTSAGNTVKGYLSSNPTTYSKCGDPVIKPTVYSSSSTYNNYTYSSNSNSYYYSSNSSNDWNNNWNNNWNTTSIINDINFTQPKLIKIYNSMGNEIKTINAPGIYLYRYSNGQTKKVRIY